MYKPRDYQAEAIAALAKARAQGKRRGLLVMASGLGKTLTSAFDIEQFYREYPQAKILILCHNDDILGQSKSKYKEHFGERYSYGFFTGNEQSHRLTDFTFATFQYMRAHRKEFTKSTFDYIVVDESHHTMAKTFWPTVRYFEPKFLLGMTATPDRMDGLDITQIYGEAVYTLDLVEAWFRKLLARVDYRLVLDEFAALEYYLDPTHQHERVSRAELNSKVFVPKRDEEIVRLVRQYSADIEEPTTFVFCRSIPHAEKVSRIFNKDENKSAAVVHSKQSNMLNRAILHDFKTGHLKTIASVNKLNEGIDVPSANVVVNLRATKSPTIFFQQLARGLRLDQGKDTVRVLSFVNCIEDVFAIMAMMDILKQRAKEYAESNGVSPDDVELPIDLNISVGKFSEKQVDIMELLYKVKTGIVWTKDELLEILRRKAKELGRTPSRAEMSKDPNVPNPEVYELYFDDWNTALRLAGLLVNRGYQREDFIKFLQENSKNGMMLSITELKAIPNAPSATTIGQMFGGLPNAAVAAKLILLRTQRQDFRLPRDEKGRYVQHLSQELGIDTVPTAAQLDDNAYTPTCEELIAEWGNMMAFAAEVNLKLHESYWVADQSYGNGRLGSRLYCDRQIMRRLYYVVKVLKLPPTNPEVRRLVKLMPEKIVYKTRFGGYRQAIELLDTYGPELLAEFDAELQTIDAEFKAQCDMAVAELNRAAEVKAAEAAKEIQRRIDASVPVLQAMVRHLGHPLRRVDIEHCEGIPSYSFYTRNVGNLAKVNELIDAERILMEMGKVS